MVRILRSIKFLYFSCYRRYEKGSQFIATGVGEAYNIFFYNKTFVSTELSSIHCCCCGNVGLIVYYFVVVLFCFVFFFLADFQCLRRRNFELSILKKEECMRCEGGEAIRGVGCEFVALFHLLLTPHLNFQAL